MILFGGYAGFGPLDDVWSVNFSGSPTWSSWTPTGTSPAARGSASAIYDPIRHRMIVFGGASPMHRDVWALTLDASPNWSQLAPDSPF
jgi:hypothetical protein